MYDKMVENWRLKPNESQELFPWKITDTMYKQNIDKVKLVFFYYKNLF
jgi:hypothetical protein